MAVLLSWLLESANAMMEFEGGEGLGAFSGAGFANPSLFEATLNEIKQRASEENEAGEAGLLRGANDLENSDLDHASEKNEAGEAHLSRVVNLLENGDLDHAIEEITKAIELQPDDPLLFLFRGLLYSEKSSHDRAIGDFNKAIELQPSNAQTYFARGIASFHKGDINASIVDFTEAVERQPDYAEAYMSRGLIRLEKRDYESALKDFKAAIKIEPDNPRPYHARARVYWSKGLLDPALSDLNKAIELNSDFAQAYVSRAWLYLTKGLHNRALDDMNKAVELNIYDAQTFLQRGQLYKEMGRTADYKEDFRSAVLLDRELVNHETLGAEFARILKADEEEETPWNDLRAALIQAQAQLDAEHEWREGWATLLDGALEAVDRFKARQKDIRRISPIAERLAVEECRDVRLELGYALNEALDRLRALTKFRSEMRRHALALESSGGEKNGFAAALLRVSRSLEAAKIEDDYKVIDEIQRENSLQAARYLATRIQTGGRTFTRDEMNER